MTPVKRWVQTYIILGRLVVVIVVVYLVEVPAIFVFNVLIFECLTRGPVDRAMNEL